MRKILSYSLWGNDPKYLDGMRANVELAAKWYPGWTVMIACPVDTMFALHVNGIAYNVMNTGSTNAGLFWRIEPATSAAADIVCIRDADSRIGERERDAVAEFESGLYALHVMRDHPAHGAEIMGGMWGCRPPMLPRNLSSLLAEKIAAVNASDGSNHVRQKYEGRFGWMSDQPFLTRVLWDALPPSQILAHDDYWRYGDCRPFSVPKPTPRDFVGQVYSATGEAKYECP